MGVPNGVPKWGSQMGVPNEGPKWGSQMGVPNDGPKWGSQPFYVVKKSEKPLPTVPCLNDVGSSVHISSGIVLGGLFLNFVNTVISLQKFYLAAGLSLAILQSLGASLLFMRLESSAQEPTTEQNHQIVGVLPYHRQQLLWTDIIDKSNCRTDFGQWAMSPTLQNNVV
jgi:hypothetical protein